MVECCNLTIRGKGILNKRLGPMLRCAPQPGHASHAIEVVNSESIKTFTLKMQIANLHTNESEPFRVLGGCSINKRPTSRRLLDSTLV